MIVILNSLGAQSVLARPQERLLAKTNAHYITLVWVGAALLAIPAILLGTVLVAGIFNADYIYLIGVLLSLPLLWFAIHYATYPFREIVVTDRSIYRIRWGRAGLGWGITKFTEIPLESVVSVLARQTIVTRALGYGEISLRLNVAPEDLKLRYMPYAQQLAGVIQRALLQRPQLPTLTEADVENTRAELQALYDRQLISKEILDVAQQDLEQHSGWIFRGEPQASQPHIIITPEPIETETPLAPGDPEAPRPEL